MSADEKISVTIDRKKQGYDKTDLLDTLLTQDEIDSSEVYCGGEQWSIAFTPHRLIVVHDETDRRWTGNRNEAFEYHCILWSSVRRWSVAKENDRLSVELHACDVDVDIKHSSYDFEIEKLIAERCISKS